MSAHPNSFIHARETWIVDQYRSGKTGRQIAIALGLSKQRIHQILKRNNLVRVTDIETRIKSGMRVESAGYQSPCWLWGRYITKDGYARFSVSGKTLRVHRVAYELYVGRIPAGLVADHLCRNRSCVNPHHLELVTNRENVRRGALANPELRIGGGIA